ncbi:MAG: hypothetical protein ACRCWR_00070, partial [Saezia sp.]
NDSTVVTIGLMAEKPIQSRSRVQIGLGLDMDLAVDDVKLSGQTNVFTLGNTTKEFNASTALDRNEVRPYAELGYSYDLPGNKGTVGPSLRLSLPEYGNNSVQYTLGLSYTLKF